jgi:hypothetical protein
VTVVAVRPPPGIDLYCVACNQKQRSEAKDPKKPPARPAS